VAEPACVLASIQNHFRIRQQWPAKSGWMAVAPRMPGSAETDMVRGMQRETALLWR
jgi:hypothetical protein